MRKNLSFFSVIALIVFLTVSCGKKSDDEGDRILSQMKKTDKIAEKAKSGDLSEEEVENALKQQSKEIANLQKKTSPDSMPDWVKKIGIPEPQGLLYVKDLSEETSIKRPNEKFNSVRLVYSGDWITAKKEAIRIAKKLKIPPMPGAAEEDSEKIGVISFSNFSIGNEQVDYIISISAERDKKILTLDITDNKQMQSALEQYQKEE